MKKFFSFLICAILVFVSGTVSAAYVYETKKTQKINDAITYEERELLTDNGWIRAYIAYVDLTNPNASVKVLTSQKGSSYLDTVRNMAKNEGAALAINGDFFNFSAGQTNMIGMTYSEGELISTPALDNMASFVITNENKVIMDYFSHSAQVTSPQGYTCPIYQVNKMPVDTGAITMLTSKWASSTPGKGYEALLVQNDVVTRIKSANEDSVPMPENGYALVTNPQINGFLSNFQAGDTVSINISITPNIGAIKEATGGNTVIVDNGKVAKFTSNITGRAQRSSVGIMGDEKTLILLAVDGRTDMCPGLTQEELARLMIELGAKKAVNLDGGGSTTFTVKNQNGTHEVKNDVSSERKVSTAIGVFSNGFIGDSANRGTLTPTQNTIVQGDTIGFDAVFYDKYENVFAHNAASTRLYDQNGNSVPFSAFCPSVGKHTIYAELGGVIASCEIEVLDELFAIDAGYEAVNLAKGNTLQLYVFGYGKEGQKTLINPSLLEWITNSSDIKLENGKVTSITGESAILCVKYKNVTDYVNVNKDKSKTKAPASTYGWDVLYGKIGGKEVAVSGNVPEGATLLNKLLSIKRQQKLSSHSYAYVTAKSYTGLASKQIKPANTFTKTKVENTSFITLNTSKGSIAKGTDWATFGKALNENLSNFVVIAEFSPDQMNAYDQNMLKGMLEKVAKNGKNVFFVSSGETTTLKIENNVRYITVGIVSDYKTSSVASTLDASRYVSFTVNGDNLRFEFLD